MEKTYATFGAILIIVAIVNFMVAQNVTVGIWPVEDPTTRNAIEEEPLLRRYWNILDLQIEASKVPRIKGALRNRISTSAHIKDSYRSTKEEKQNSN